MAEVFHVSYFNWWLVGIYIVLLAIFLYGILQPRKRTEWRSAGAAQAWVIALYAEMYGVPLTAYWVMGFLGRSQQDAEVHYNGHLWPLIFGVGETNLVMAQFICTAVGQALVLVGALLAIFGWRQLHKAVKEKRMAQTGLYRWVRHPQYTGFFLFLLGSMINWPTLVTIVCLPILLAVYVRLALTEERLAYEEFGADYEAYAKKTGRFFPKLAWPF